MVRRYRWYSSQGRMALCRWGKELMQYLVAKKVEIGIGIIILEQKVPMLGSLLIFNCNKINIFSCRQTILKFNDILTINFSFHIQPNDSLLMFTCNQMNIFLRPQATLKFNDILTVFWILKKVRSMV